MTPSNDDAGGPKGRRRGLLAGLGGAVAGSLAAGTGLAAPAVATPLRLLGTHLTGTERARNSTGTLRVGDRLELGRVADRYDARAVAAATRGGGRLGLVARIDNQAVASLLEAGYEPYALVTAVEEAGPRPDIRIDVMLPLPAAGA